MLGNHRIALFRQRQTEPVLFIARGSRGIAMSQMDKEFKLHTALAIEQRQFLCFDIDADFFLDLTPCGMRRRLILLQAAGHRLPEFGIIAPL
ncbi:hypothetical protein D3C72_2352810 [compost metagenome]